MLKKAFIRHLSSSSLQSRPSLLTALHRITNLLPRVLAKHSFVNVVQPPPLEPLDQPPPPARITFFGSSKWAGTEQLVTALLEQPFLPDDSLSKAVRNRWNARQDKKITIAYGKQIQWQGSTLYIPSSFLQQFPFSVEIDEYSAEQNPDPHPFDSKHENLPAEAWYNSDVPVVLCNPVTDHLPSLPLKHPNAIRVLTSSTPIRDNYPPRTLFIDPLRALAGLSALRENSNSQVNVQRYQDNFVGSRLPSLTSHIKHSLASPVTLDLLRMRRLTTQFTAVCDAISGSLKEAENEVEENLSKISELREEYEQDLNKLPRMILGIYDASVPDSKQHSLVATALANSERQIRTQIDRFTWRKMFSHIDEINVIVNRIVDEAWCKELEYHLIAQAARLGQTQHHYTRSAFDLFTPSSPFDSPVLHNTLKQISSAPSYKLEPSALTLPIYSRKSQIAGYPTVRLHLAAHRSALGTTFSVFTGMWIGWAGWVGWLTGTGEGLLGLVAIDATTSIGLGMLIAVAGIRWGVGKWERAKKIWWGDWYRVGEGLERDLSTTLDRALKEQVTILSRTACESLSDIAVKTTWDIEQYKDELKSIQSDLERSKSG
ncbi:hypothetical protein DFH05DRAFT_1475161 [Lentinula detonsa]|uniref:Transmembrane protein n=1 Tax=Lentinula detonsa TaxID=2804962 RepID=A0A9W8U1T9_9AGAR|nr:hypothetical protein DFH05DRAFT_1475161 [Lentinula detonsa]